MVSVNFRKSVNLRIVVLGLIAVFGAMTITTGEADARRYKSGKGIHARSKSKSVRSRAATARYNPPYAAIVVDANSGAVLHENSADSPRHPASLTKIMTLYMLFERLEVGKIKLDTEMDVSAHAASQSPSKLGLKAGSNIRVEDAIRSLVTKSANDAAVVVAETLGGDEPEFARMMTRKARALGMKGTLYRNASGLPNPEQITTARDQALLGRAIQDRFPKYYRYFSTPSFTYRGHAMRNHNRLLGNVEGVDGIKTGYVAASGFNLVTSVRRGNRHLVAVVLGGRTGGLRDARMRELIAEHITVASTRRTAPAIAEAPESAVPVAQSRTRVAAQPFSDETETPVRAAATIKAAAAPAAVSAPANPDPAVTAALPADPNEDLKPIAVKTVKVKASALQTAAIGSVAVAAVSAPASVAAPAQVPANVSARALVSAPTAPVAAVSPPIRTATIDTKATAPVAAQLPPQVQPSGKGDSAKAPDAGKISGTRFDPKYDVVRPERAKAEPAKPTVAASEPVKVAAVEPTPRAATPQRTIHSGWIVQVGALDSVEAAKDRLAAARAKAMNILGRADAFTEPVTKGDKTLHRARFAGFDKDHAEAACKALKRADIVCMTIKN
jgi:D-alanyl-D-alanine carboxypeptidase